MRQTYKDVFSDAYYEAQEEGLPEAECERIGTQAMRDWLEAKQDAAELRRDDARTFYELADAAAQEKRDVSK